MPSPQLTVKHLKDCYNASRKYVEWVQSSAEFSKRNDISEFWQGLLKQRINFPTFNEMLNFRRGYSFGVGDRTRGEINLENERLYVETAHWIVSHRLPSSYWNHVHESAIGCPFIFEVDGQPMSASGVGSALTAYQVLQALKAAGVEKRPLRILEIGAGYGQMAHQLMSQLNVETYAICDLPENLFLSSFYLPANFPEKSKRFIQPDASLADESSANLIFASPQALKKIPGQFDLVINSYSFQEMNLSSVQEYFQFASERLVEDGIFYSLNSHGKSGVLTPDQYPLENFEILKFQIPRIYQIQVFATTPYELVLSPSKKRLKTHESNHFSALAYLAQAGLGAELTDICEKFSSQSLNGEESEYLEEVLHFFNQVDLAKTMESLKMLSANSPSFQNITAFLEGSSHFFMGNWAESSHILTRFMRQAQKSQATLFAQFMIFASAKNLNETAVADGALKDLLTEAPLFSSEIEYYTNHYHRLPHELAKVFRLKPSQTRRSIRMLWSAAQQKVASRMPKARERKAV